jgi:hypothetical protein
MSFEVFMVPAMIAYVWFFLAVHRSLKLALVIPAIVLAFDLIFVFLDFTDSRNLKRFAVQLVLFAVVFAPIVVVALFQK